MLLEANAKQIEIPCHCKLFEIHMHLYNCSSGINFKHHLVGVYVVLLEDYFLDKFKMKFDNKHNAS
jgi:hypothetical protein